MLLRPPATTCTTTTTGLNGRSALQHTTMECIQGKKPGRVAPRRSGSKDRYVQIGKVAALATWTASTSPSSHDDGKTAQVYTSDGGRLGGNHEITTRYRDDDAPAGIKFGDRVVQIGTLP